MDRTTDLAKLGMMYRLLAYVRDLIRSECEILIDVSSVANESPTGSRCRVKIDFDLWLDDEVVQHTDCLLLARVKECDESLTDMDLPQAPGC